MTVNIKTKIRLGCPRCHQQIDATVEWLESADPCCHGCGTSFKNPKLLEAVRKEIARAADQIKASVKDLGKR